MKKIKYVNILTSSKHPLFLRQLDKQNAYENYIFFENSTENHVWDNIIVYEEISEKLDLRCYDGGLIFVSGEPSDSRYYGRKFLNQFDVVVATHPYIKHKNYIYSQTSINWHFGYSHELKRFAYDMASLKAMPLPQKSKIASVITSSKKMMPGHLKRLKLIEKLKSKFGDKIDFFGKGINPIDDKKDALIPYYFHICLENSVEKHYWSEKIADAFLGFCVPIYSGAPNIEEYFPHNSYIPIDIDNIDSVAETLTPIFSEPEKYYFEKLNDLENARKLVLEKYNFFPFLINIIETKSPMCDRMNDVVLLPNSEFLDAKLGILKLRLRRLFYKLYFLNIMR